MEMFQVYDNAYQSQAPGLFMTRGVVLPSDWVGMYIMLGHGVW
jgi:hypothetical protein